jgi:hypothetical protein
MQKLPRPLIALQANIGTERLASYETGRAPLPYQIGSRICSWNEISQVWLALGTGNIGGFREWKRPKFEGTGGSFFSVVSSASAEISAIAPRGFKMDAMPPASGMTIESVIMDLANWHRGFVTEIPPSLLPEYFQMITSISADFLQKHKAEIGEWAQSVFARSLNIQQAEQAGAGSKGKLVKGRGLSRQGKSTQPRD